MADHFQIRLPLNVIFRVFMAFVTCTVGAIFGIITGAIKGQTMETGMLRGAGVGALSGAVVALQVIDTIANGEPISKVALLQSLLHGKLFIEWISAMETSLAEIFDSENNATRGLSEEVIHDLPSYIFEGLSEVNQKDTCNETNCAICLEDFENKEEVRELPSCRHMFHINCIDEWLIRQGSCPICRRDVTF
ncbi:NEP1-interacting protein 2-like [Bidens hawaiensis]|uniref:NEP1-interacting protein 2-like n=1 Tax=Bidens hawaiensis TaxID=980011 RepID=UPI00404B0F13